MTRPTRVLIADDDDSFREVLASIISEMPGVELVGEARNGQEMIALAAVLRPDIVLTDVNMPIVDGIAATRLLKAMPNPPMVVVSSCDSRAETRAAALAAGADAFIRKREMGQPSLLMHIPSRTWSAAEKVTEVNENVSPLGPTANRLNVPFARVGQDHSHS